MDKKTTSWVSYLSWVGWLIAYFTGDKEGAKFHLNQSLVIMIFSTGSMMVGVIPVLGWIVAPIVGIFSFVCWIIGLISAINQEEKEVPLIGQIKILK